jgi:hypothetical protein
VAVAVSVDPSTTVDGRGDESDGPSFSPSSLAPNTKKATTATTTAMSNTAATTPERERFDEAEDPDCEESPESFEWGTGGGNSSVTPEP